MRTLGMECVPDDAEIRRIIDALAQANDQARTITNPAGSGTLNVAIAPVGVGGDCGVIVAGSGDDDFPG